MTKGSGIHGDAGKPAGAGTGERATVLAKLANGMFRLQTTAGREVVAHTALDLRMAFARLLPGDQVQIEVSPFDPNKARICKLLPSSQPAASTRSRQTTTPTDNPPESNQLQRELP